MSCHNNHKQKNNNNPKANSRFSPTVPPFKVLLLFALLLSNVTCWPGNPNEASDFEALLDCYTYCRMLYLCESPAIDSSASKDDCRSKCEEAVQDKNSSTPDSQLLDCAQHTECQQFEDCLKPLDNLNPAASSQ